MGADKEVESDFQLIAGTNRDLQAGVERGRFREDLLARINLWTFRLPALRERPEDIEPNLDYELEQAAHALRAPGDLQQRGARALPAPSRPRPRRRGRGNFRDFNAAVPRMATLAPGGRITREVVDEEIARLRAQWATGARSAAAGTVDLVAEVLGDERGGAGSLRSRAARGGDCRVPRPATLSEAGRVLFAASRARKASTSTTPTGCGSTSPASGWAGRMSPRAGRPKRPDSARADKQGRRAGLSRGFWRCGTLRRRSACAWPASPPR